MSDLIKTYNHLFPLARKGKLDIEDQGRFTATSERLWEELSLDVILPGSEHAEFQAQLVGKDAVHDFGVRDVNEMKRYRLGTFDGNKAALALVNQNGDAGKPEILAAIYTYMQQNGPVDHYTKLAGDVHNILNEEVVAERKGDVSAAIFYSISTLNIMKGAGPMLIAKLHARLNQMFDNGVVFSTLSPLRGLVKWADESGSVRPMQGDEALYRHALLFLLDNRDGVQMFHMGNGAQIGDINLRANTPDSKDGVLGRRVMVNYVYPRSEDAVLANRATYEKACALRAQGNEKDAVRLLFSMMAPHLRDACADDVALIVRGDAPALRCL